MKRWFPTTQQIMLRTKLQDITKQLSKSNESWKRTTPRLVTQFGAIPPMSRRQGACGKNFTNKLSSNYNDVIICNDSTNIESHSYNLTLQKSLRLPLNMRLHLSGLRLPLRLCVLVKVHLGRSARLPLKMIIFSSQAKTSSLH